MTKKKQKTQTSKNAIHPLHQAARDGATDRLADIVGSGISINAKDNNNETALVVAIKYAVKQTVRMPASDAKSKPHRYEDTVKQLIELGADVNLQCGNKRMAALHYALTGECSNIVRILVKAGADMNVACDPFPQHYTFRYVKTPFEIARYHHPDSGNSATLVEAGILGGELSSFLFESNAWNHVARLSQETINNDLLTGCCFPSVSMWQNNRFGLNGLDFLWLRDFLSFINKYNANTVRYEQYFLRTKQIEAAYEEILSCDRHQYFPAAPISLAIIMATATDKVLEKIYPQAIKMYAYNAIPVQVNETSSSDQKKDAQDAAGFMALVNMINEVLYYEPFLAYSLTGRLYKIYGDLPQYYKWLACALRIDTQERFGHMRQHFRREVVHFLHVYDLGVLITQEMTDHANKPVTTNAERYQLAIHYYLEIIRAKLYKLDISPSGDDMQYNFDFEIKCATVLLQHKLDLERSEKDSHYTLTMFKKCLLSAQAYANQCTVGILKQNPLHLLAIYFPDAFEEEFFVTLEKIDNAIFEEALAQENAAGLTAADYCLLFNRTDLATKWLTKAPNNIVLTLVVESEQQNIEYTTAHKMLITKLKHKRNELSDEQQKLLYSPELNALLKADNDSVLEQHPEMLIASKSTTVINDVAPESSSKQAKIKPKI